MLVKMQYHRPRSRDENDYSDLWYCVGVRYKNDRIDICRLRLFFTLKFCVNRDLCIFPLSNSRVNFLVNFLRESSSYWLKTCAGDDKIKRKEFFF